MANLTWRLLSEKDEEKSVQKETDALDVVNE